MEVRKKERGFTLVEALVALVILAILLLGLLSGLILTYELSTRNLIRDEAVKIASEYAEKYRNAGPENIPAEDEKTVQRKIRNTLISYNVSITSSDLSAGNLKKVVIKVTWNYRGKTYSHTIETLVAGQ